MPDEKRQHQVAILDCAARYLSEERAVDGINNRILERIVKSFSRQGHEFQDVFIKMIFNHIVKSNFAINVASVMEMAKCQFIGLQMLGLKILKIISDPNNGATKRFGMEFENYIRPMLDLTLNKDRPVEQTNVLLEIISHLAIDDYLAPEIIHNNGIDTLLLHLREQGNLEGQRMAAKGLLNLGAKSRDDKLKIVSELSYEIKLMGKNNLDPLIKSYISALMQSRM